MSSFLGCMLIGISIILVVFSALMLWDMFDDRFDRILCLFIVLVIVPLSAIGGWKRKNDILLTPSRGEIWMKSGSCWNRADWRIANETKAEMGAVKDRLGEMHETV